MSATTVRVFRQALRGNFRAFAKRVGGPSRLVPVLKANAYGHGLEIVLKALQGLQMRALAVAHATEALTLHRLYKGRILVLSAWQDAEAKRAVAERIELVAWDKGALRKLSRFGTHRKPALVHIKVDSGTGRLGSRSSDAARLLRTAARTPRVRLVGAFTHFADAEEETDGYTLRQLHTFLELTRGLPLGVERHAACSAAALRFPDTSLDYVRLGIGLYGLWPSSRTRRAAGFSLTPSLQWETHVLQIKVLPAGEPVGYGRTFRTRRTSTLAVLPVGYADGYPRSLSNRGVVLVRGRRCPVVGRVSMNLTVVDATGTSAAPGDTVILLGRQGGVSVNAEELARRAGTIHYELVTRIAPSVPRMVA